MKTNKLIALIGGTGKAGRYIRAELLKRNYAVRMLFRKPSPLIDSQIETVIGDVCDFSKVNDLVRDCFAVVSALGHPGGERMIFHPASEGIMRAMAAHHVKKYILLSGINVDFPDDRKGPLARAATEWMQLHYPAQVRDREKEVALLRASPTDWTLVRLPLIRFTDEMLPINVALDDCRGDSINAGALAAFVADQLDSHEFERRAPFIWNA